jgi:hypothetical protein
LHAAILQGNAGGPYRLRLRHVFERECTMGRNVTISVGALIIIVIIVALIF